MIEGKFVKFRSLESKDLIKLKEWRNENKVRKTTREYRLLSMINQKKWLEKLQMENPPSSIMFGIVNNNKILIGVCGLTYIDWKNKHAEISEHPNRFSFWFLNLFLGFLPSKKLIP